MPLFENEVKVSGVEINYFFVCKRKLWFYTHGISMEQNSIRVEMGKEVHDVSLESKRSEMMIDETIRIDYIDKELAVHEIKMSRAMEDASRYQILYYIYYLRNKGIDCKKGVIHFPEMRKTESIEYNEEYEKIIKEAVESVNIIKKLSNPPTAEKSKKCKSCSYFELCFC
ncbi:MAG: CRISPR-associated protein Cas4 [Caloramator sp.]|nr:CRISPR-associated protein Cas4 [Caloramator sp.]